MSSDFQHPVINIHLLGQFEITRGKQALKAKDWNRQKAATLLKRLAWERKLLKDVVIDELWPNASLSSSANNLYRALHELRRTLDTYLGEGTADQVVSFSDGILTLSDSVWVDAHEYESAAKRFNTQYLVSNYAGDFLPDDLYESWTQAPREQLYQRYREAVLSLVGENPAQAIGLLPPLLGRDPLDEPVHRALMRAYALSGRRHDALRQYQTCVSVLNSELGIAPDPQTTELYEQILQGELVASIQESSHLHQPGLAAIPIHVELEKSAPFVGRHTELEVLLQRVQAAKGGNGEVILLAGDTGVGKTRLAYEVLRAAASSGMGTLLGACYEQEGQLPYQPFIEAFNRYLSDRNLPLDQNPILHFKRLGATDPQQEQWALFNAAASFLREITQQAPLVFMVDDLHAADETSLSLFHFLARQTRSVPLILLATYRVDIPSMRSKPFGVLLNALYRERLGESVEVEYLGLEDVTGIISPILGGAVDSALVEAIFNVTEGNPFFIQEVTRSLLVERLIEQKNDLWYLLPDSKLPIPSRLTELLLERVGHLGENAKSTLAAGAVLGREFRFDLLRGLSGLSDGETLDALDAALAGHLLEETEAGYRFQ